jgi:hypothetical protein
MMEGDEATNNKELGDDVSKSKIKKSSRKTTNKKVSHLNVHIT